MARPSATAPALAALLLATLLHGSAAVAPGAAAAPEPQQRGRRLQQYPYPYDQYDRRSRAGWASGKRAAGQPGPVAGLANPDVPALANYSASMEGGWQGCPDLP
jgi:hypothetical protein